MSYPTPDMRFEDTGESRPPRQGEWFTGIVGPSLAPQDFFSPRPILKRTDNGPRSEDELERESLDAEEAARQVEKREELERKFQAIPAPPAPRLVTGPKPNDLRPLREIAPAAAREYLPYSEPEED